MSRDSKDMCFDKVLEKNLCVHITMKSAQDQRERSGLLASEYGNWCKAIADTVAYISRFQGSFKLSHEFDELYCACTGLVSVV